MFIRVYNEPINLNRDKGVCMILKTKHFGEIEIKEEDIINFVDGIPGFKNYPNTLS